MYRGRRIAAIAVARAASTRLPGKMLLPFGRATVVESALEAAAACDLVDTVIFATSSNPQDDPLAAIAAERGLTVVRGSEHDVTGRMRKALDAVPGGADALVRLCCDNPLVDPALMDAALRDLIDTSADLVTPAEYATLPFGAAQVVMTADCLRRIDAGAQLSLHREHVENYCFDTPAAFRVRYQKAPIDAHMPELILTLDYPEDYTRLKRMEAMLAGGPIPGRITRLVDTLRRCRIAVSADTAVAGRVADLLPKAAHDSSAPDLVINTAPGWARNTPAGCVHPVHLGGNQWSLAYGPGSPPDFPTGPLAVQDVYADDAATALFRLLPYALPHLLGAPVRVAAPANHVEGLQSAPEKTSGAQRAGFAQAHHAQTPPHIAIPHDLPLWRLYQVITELREDWTTDYTIAVTGRAGSETHEYLRAHLSGAAITQTSNLAADPFSTIRVTADTTLPLKAIWRGPSYRRARVDILNNADTPNRAAHG